MATSCCNGRYRAINILPAQGSAAPVPFADVTIDGNDFESDEVYDAGSAAQSSTYELEVEVTNNGTDLLTLEDPTVTSGDVTVDAFTDLTLNPLETATFTITIGTGTIGNNFTAEIQFNSDSALYVPFIINLLYDIT